MRKILLFLTLFIALASCRTFPQYTDEAMTYDDLVYRAQWRFIVVPKEVENQLPERKKLSPRHKDYERLFWQGEVLPILVDKLLSEDSFLSKGDFILECDSLLLELSQMDPVRDYQSAAGVRQAPKIYAQRDLLIKELKSLRQRLKNTSFSSGQ